MGMYTGIQFEATLKPEFVELIHRLHEADSVDDFGEWESLTQTCTHLWLAEYAFFSRADHIPFGWSAYFDYEEPKLEGRKWTVCCSLKNYDGTVEKFLETILPAVAESVEHCSTRYEECERWTKWKLEDGKMVQVPTPPTGNDYWGWR